MAQFFIDRPVFAWVVSILIIVLGALSITQLPVAQYPNVAPPSISVSANYAGASAETLQETVTSVIEQQLNAIYNLLYMSSRTDASGLATVTLYFHPGTNPDTAQVQVQNKVQLALPSLPQTVQQQGVVVAKATRNFMMFFTLSTVNDSLDEVALGNYIASSVLDPIRRVSGVGEANMFGSQYAMRVWLNPDKLNSFNLTAADVTTAIQNQNAQVPVGQIDCAGVPRHVFVSPEYSRHAHPDDCCPGRPARHLRRDAGLSLFHQCSDAVWDGAGNRYPGGRCHCGC